MRFLVHAATLRRRARPNTHLGARLLVEHAAAPDVDACSPEHTLVPEAHLLNTPPLRADALTRTHTLVPGYLLNRLCLETGPALLGSLVEHAATLDVDTFVRLLD